MTPEERQMEVLRKLQLQVNNKQYIVNKYLYILIAMAGFWYKNSVEDNRIFELSSLLSWEQCKKKKKYLYTYILLKFNDNFFQILLQL